jgi:hypothetical protein
MFPSKTPLLFVIQIVAILIALMGVVVGGILLNQPLLLALAVFGLNAFPGIPVMNGEDEKDEKDEKEETSDYSGTGGTGFIRQEE